MKEEKDIEGRITNVNGNVIEKLEVKVTTIVFRSF